MGNMMRGKRSRKGECRYGCCRLHLKREARGMYRARDKRSWKRSLSDD